MAESIPPLLPAKEPPKGQWAKTTLWLVVLLVVAVNLALLVRSCVRLPGEALDKAGRVIEKTGRALADVAAAFKQGKVTTEFVSYATSLTNESHFQFATLKQTELFTRAQENTTGFGYIPLPEVVVEARAPVEYTYFLDLNGHWDFLLKDNVVYVLAPPIRFNKPAVDASAISYEVRRGYLKTADALENLKKSITSMVKVKATDNIELVRENGRRQTSEFVERWLTRSFTDGKSYPVKVYFPGEKLPEGITLGKEKPALP
jgi:hypothetical protein